jgi:hypothetical protein
MVYAFYGTGTVTSFSAGNLSPLFTTSVATSTTTPALSFALSNAAQNAFLLGPVSGGAGSPTYRTFDARDWAGSSATGGLAYSTSSSATGWLAVGSANQFLGVAAGAPSWTSLSGDGTLSAGALTVTKVQGITYPSTLTTGDIYYASASNTLSKLAIGTASQVLTVVSGAPAWGNVTTVPAAGTAGRILYDDGANWVRSAAGSTGQTLRMNGTVPTFNSVLTNDGNTVGFNPGASNVGFTLAGATSQKGAIFTGATGSATIPVLDITNNAVPGIWITNSSSPSSSAGAGINLFAGQDPTAVNHVLGQISAGRNVSGTVSSGAQMKFSAAEDWSGGNRGTFIDWLTQSAGGSAGLVARMRLTSKGTLITNKSGSALATNATDAFLGIPNMAGTPSGTPSTESTATGATNVVIDTTAKKLWAYLGSTWGAIGVANNGNHNITISNSTPVTYTMDVADSGVTAYLTSTGVATAQLPSAATANGRSYFFAAQTGNSANFVINRTGSDTFDATGATGITLTSGQTAILYSDGTYWWRK